MQLVITGKTEMYKDMSPLSHYIKPVHNLKHNTLKDCKMVNKGHKTVTDAKPKYSLEA